MSRLLFNIGLFFVLFQATAYGQSLEMGVYGNPYLKIDSYDGGTSSGIFSLYITQRHGVNVDIENWRLSVRLLTPILATDDGTEFPADKISFIHIETKGEGVPNIGEIGIASPVSLSSSTEVFLVPNARTPLKNEGDYCQLLLDFNLSAAAGTYLENLYNKTGEWVKYYSVTFQFTLYDGNNTAIEVVNFPWRNFQVHRLTGDPPPDENQYSIRVSTEASNGLLEFKTMADYLNGKSVTYTDGLSVSATTAYQVTVRSIPAHFSSAVGNTLPLDVVRLQLTGGAGTMAPVALSTDTKTILQGLSTNGASQHFDITYSTEANDARLFNVPSDHYTTSLMYEISPR
jgi:hypothetical protein